MNKLKVGAVVYAPRVTVIWGIIADFFKEEGFEIEPIYYKDYRSQVDGLMKGEIDVAWNSPLAWLDANLRTNGKALNGSMRDTDNDRSTYLVVKKSSNIKSIDYVEKRFDIGIGLHGDHVGGELDSAKAMLNGEVDATWMLDLNYDAWIQDGTIDKNQVDIIYKTPFFDHCIFSGRPDLKVEKFEMFAKILHKMDYNNPEHKEMMDMEGLKKWVIGRTTGFEQIKNANEYINFLETFYK